MINNMIMINLLMMSMLNFFLSIMFILSKNSIIINWSLINLNSCNIKFIILIDWLMLMFISVVMFISSMVMLYSKEYMLMEMKKNYFIIILTMFIISMILMIISPNIISVILGWDGLGLISYCLIIYYQNLNSFNSGMLTLLTNRIGDIMLLMMIFLMINLGSWNLLMFKLINFSFIMMLLIMMMTKSAQIPFSIWLPAAMAAPTPVSSLVHSSTLVTAGIYLLIRFNKIFLINNMKSTIMIIGLLTMLTSSLNAMFEFDLKKIIAFSTLSQLGLMMMMMSFNLYTYVFFHLISHAMFKSLLFLCSGIMIHFMNNMQDIRFMGSLINQTPLIILMFNFSSLSLCGLPFLSGFFSKDLLYEMTISSKINLMIYNFMYLCIMLTIIYNLRLMYYLTINNNMFITLNMKIDNYLMSMSIIMLFFMSIMFGNWMNWLMFSSINFSMTNLNSKMLLYSMMIMGISSMFINKKINYTLLNLFNSFFFLKKLSMIFNSYYIYMNKNIININELSWNEYYNMMIPNMMIKLMNKMFNLMFINKLIMIIMTFIILMLLTYLI
uniref:NADH-ubiquinone oxidoreductase chain 5 n=1 Tax=Figites sp. ZJUH 20220010 TaxID=2995277 RepID=A0A9E8GBB8_9HYME|nr:NADH dehydrogenase subunit 5 [Figites sp. ZJUH 20220010]